MKCITIFLLLISAALSYGQTEHPAFRQRLDYSTCCDSLTEDLNRTFPFSAGQPEGVRNCGHHQFS